MYWIKTVSARVLISFVLIFVTSCNVVKHLPDNQRLYNGYEINIQDGGFLSNMGLKGNIGDEIQPEPNRRLFGVFPLKLWLYNIAGDSVPEKGFRHWLKEKAGEPPVLFNDLFAERSRVNIQNYLFNNGYFDSRVNVNVLENNRKVKLVFDVNADEPYRIQNYYHPDITDTFTSLVFQTKKETKIKKGNIYSINKLTDERVQITDYLKNQGYYAFSPNYLMFRIDSNRIEKKLNIYLTVKENTPDEAFDVYRINNVTVYPDYSIGRDSIPCDTSIVRYPTRKAEFADDSARAIRNYKFISCKKNIKPLTILNSLLIEEEAVYSTFDYSSSLNKIMGLGVFKYANIELIEVENEDTALLNANVYLTQAKPRSFRAELQAVSKSNDFVGPGLNLSYNDKNLLKGAEAFSLSTLTGFETQFSGRQSGLFSYEIRVETQLQIPKFIVPFINANRFIAKRYTAHTQMKAGFGYTDRVNYFTNRAINFSFGYNWRETPTKSHEFNPITIDYSNLGRITPVFDSILRIDDLVRQSFEDRFIFSLIYNYTLNDQLNEKPKETNNYFNGNIEFAGNVLSLANRVINGEPPDAENPTPFLGTVYSQYIRTFTDYRIYFSSGKNNVLVTRFFAGLGVPYGNSKVLPYSKQFFSGGASSLRGFKYRSVGPGSYESGETGSIFIDQTGDIKLEGNVEFRFVITKLFRGAFFTDVGNIWFVRNNPSKPGGTFLLDKFLDDLAMDVGLGLRLDVTFFVLRLDLAFPVRIPYANKKWVFDKIDFTSSSWIKDNLVLNIAIGYPF